MPNQDVFYRRNLPHVHPDGYPIFITFRLANSLPQKVLEELHNQRKQELQLSKGKTPDELYQIEKRYFGRYDAWFDQCADSPRWLEDPQIASYIAEKIHGMDGIKFTLLAYCIMPNHVHLLIESLVNKKAEHQGKAARYPVTDTLRLLKGSTARECNILLKRDGHFWSQESYDHYVRDNEELARIIEYILNNPVKAGLVKEWTEWKFSYVNPELGMW